MNEKFNNKKSKINKTKNLLKFLLNNGKQFTESYTVTISNYSWFEYHENEKSQNQFEIN